MGALIMAAAAVLAFAAGLAEWPWYLIAIGAIAWSAGFFLYSPETLGAVRAHGHVALIMSGVVTSYVLVSGALFWMGRVLSGRPVKRRRTQGLT